MSTDAQSETPRSPPPPRVRLWGDRQVPSSSRWWIRGLQAIGVIAVLASAAVLIPAAMSSREIVPKLIHPISRGDLVVTMTLVGTVESSVNTEIKCKVRTASVPILWVIESGSEVKPGDELVRLGTLEFEDRILQVSKWTHVTRSAAERSKADLANAELAISEYLEGRYRSDLMNLEKDLAIAESNLRVAQNMLDHAKMLAERGYASALEVEERTFAVTRAELNVEIKKTEIDVLRNYTKAMELETLNGNLKATKARHDADMERAKQLADQLPLALADLEHCVVKAERRGLVMYPTAEPWKRAPEIEVGATVYMGQTLLIMPDLSKMQVKISVPEDTVQRIKPGLAARITLQDETLDGQVSSVASVTAPTSRWTGSIVTYDTTVKLPSVEGLSPGMSAEVEVIIGRHSGVFTIPVAAVVETAAGNFCWVKTAEGARRRALELGETNDVFTVIKAGVEEGDEVFLNPHAFEGKKAGVVKPLDKASLL